MAYKRSLKDKKVLITCGPTWVPIDDVRIISNKSTGELGQTIAIDCAKAGAKVKLLEGPVIFPLKTGKVRVKRFYYYDEFLKLVRAELKTKYDVIIHAAAVSDYKLKKPFPKKLASSLNKVTVELARTQKIIHLFKQKSSKIFLVGFKLGSHVTEKTSHSLSKELFTKAKCDLVVANTVIGESYHAYVIDKDKNILAHKKKRNDLSKTLIKLVKENL